MTDRLTFNEVIMACRNLSKDIKRVNREFRKIRLAQEDLHLKNMAIRMQYLKINNGSRIGEVVDFGKLSLKFITNV